jgi:hypothetical protein
MEMSKHKFDREELSVVRAAVEGRIRGAKRSSRIIQGAIKKGVHVLRRKIKRMKDHEDGQEPTP